MAVEGELERLSIVQATPSVWGSGTEIDVFVRRTSQELVARGHRVAVIAPSGSRAEAREGLRRVRAAAQDPEALFGASGEVSVLGIGGAPPIPRSRGRKTPVPGEAARRIQEALAAAPIDIVHVHDPFLPSVPSTALRYSFALNVGTFHLPHERPLSTLLARPLVEIFFGRLDARTVTHRATGELLDRFFPGSYELIGPGADGAGAESSARPEVRPGPIRILFPASEERGALRLFLRALRRLPKDLDWLATVAVPEGSAIPRVAAGLRERIEFVRAQSEANASGTLSAPLISGHDVLCLASSGSDPTPTAITEALAGAATPIVSDISVYADLVEDDGLGLLFPTGDADTLAGQIARHAAAGRASTRPPARNWSQVADELEQVYRTALSRRHPADGDPAIRERLVGRDLIEVDLHMHTDHSSDCATPVRVLLETARDRGLGAIAITDHNEISGALAAREIAAGMDGIEVIVGEEVKTAEQGEVIGLFLEEKIERGMSMAETIAEIRRQGGLVYMPHPFDRLHSVPDYEHLVEIVEEIDFMEVFNPRVAIDSFNEEAERFARKYRIIPAAGSDSHVAQGLGSVRIRLPRFEGPEEFREAMRDAEITRRHKNLVYVQALKFLQTTGRPKAPKRTLATASPVRGGRPRNRL